MLLDGPDGKGPSGAMHQGHSEPDLKEAVDESLQPVAPPTDNSPQPMAAPTDSSAQPAAPCPQPDAPKTTADTGRLQTSNGHRMRRRPGGFAGAPIQVHIPKPSMTSTLHFSPGTYGPASPLLGASPAAVPYALPGTPRPTPYAMPGTPRPSSSCFPLHGSSFHSYPAAGSHMQAYPIPSSPLQSYPFQGQPTYSYQMSGMPYHSIPYSSPSWAATR